MIAKKVAAVMLLACALLLMACREPAKWAEELESLATCGMPKAELERIARRPIEVMEVPRGWTTHVIRDESTEVWLGLAEDKLLWLQVAWAAKPTKMATYQKVDLCGSTPDDPHARHPLPSNVPGTER